MISEDDVKIKAIIFDFDGVLVESIDIKTNSFARLFEPEGDKVVKQVVNYHLLNTGVSRFEKFRYIYKNILNRELSNETFNELCKNFSGLVVEEVVKAPFVNGAKEFLDIYMKKYKFFICSGTPQDEIEGILRRRNMSVYFKEVYGSPNKKADIVRKIIQDNNLLPSEVVYIGDALSDYKAARANSVNFIARINNNEYIFDNNFDCIKVKNLINLNEILSNINSENKIKKAYDFISSVNKKGYNDIYLLSNQVLSKNPFTNNFLRRYLNNEKVKQPKIYFIFSKLLIYYFLSLKDFISYFAEFIEYFISRVHFYHSRDKKELILIDTYFIIDKIRKAGSYMDADFPDLVDLLKKTGRNYAYLPVFDGMKRRSTIYKIFGILKKDKISVLSEYQLLSISDLFYILYFIIVYPFRVLKFSKSLDSSDYEQNLLSSELINTSGQVTFRSFSRYLQGRRIAELPYENIKVFSWYENQVIDKNLYKGLRINTNKVKIYGAQLFLYSKDILNIIPDENEAVFGIVPDKILVNGPIYIPEKSNLNYIVGPSLRHWKIFNSDVKKEKRRNILILLPYYKDDNENILRMLKRSKLLSEQVFIKVHPAVNIGEFKYLLPSNATIVNDDIYQLFETIKILISTASGTLVVAASLGIPAITIRSPRGFDCNPLPDYGKGLIWEEVSSPEGLKQQINKFEYMLDRNRSEIDNIASIYKRNFFCEPSEKNIVESFNL